MIHTRRTISKFISTRPCFRRVLFILLIIILAPLCITKTKFETNYTISHVSTTQSVIIKRYEQNSITQSIDINRYEQNSITQSININRYEPKMHCIIYFVESLGRFANQMFMIASAYGLARLHSCYLYLSPSLIEQFKETFIFDLSSSLILPSMANLTSINITSGFYQCQYLPKLARPNAFPPGTAYELKGYWQSYLHFAQYGNELREQIFVGTPQRLVNIAKLFVDLYKSKFNVTRSFSSNDHHLLKKQVAQSNFVTWIGMHVRRGDFTHPLINLSSSDDYLFFAMKYYTSLYSNAHFLVASDDKPYCKNLFRNYSNIFFTPETFSGGEDLITLSLCQHSIATGGTFSWWSAYLANGKVVHDKVYPPGCEKREHYYPPWFIIDGDTRDGKT